MPASFMGAGNYECQAQVGSKIIGDGVAGSSTPVTLV